MDHCSSEPNISMYSGTNYFRSRPGRLAKVFQRFSGSFVVITESEWQMYASSQHPGRPSQLPPCDTSGLCLSNRPLIIWKVTSTNSLTYNLIWQEEIRNYVLYSTTLSRFLVDTDWGLLWTIIHYQREQISLPLHQTREREAKQNRANIYDIDNIW